MVSSSCYSYRSITYTSSIPQNEIGNQPSLNITLRGLESSSGKSIERVYLGVAARAVRDDGGDYETTKQSIAQFEKNHVDASATVGMTSCGERGLSAPVSNIIR